jgi:23S rRNA C2498 (ribose-2'-O)-methylase RlmM
MSLTPITKDQWKSIGKGALFILGSTAVAVGVAYASNQPSFVLYMPVINFLAIVISKFFIKSEAQVITTLPIEVQPQATTIVATATTDLTAAVESALNVPPTPPQA